MELKKKKTSTRIIGAVIFGVFTNIGAFVLLAYIMYLMKYGGEGLPRLFSELLFEPGYFFETIVFGQNTDNDIHQKLHVIYTDIKIQAFFWLAYFGFVYLSFTNNKTLVKREASEYGSHGTARFATDKEIKESFQKEKRGIILGEHRGKRVIHPFNSRRNQNIAAFGGSGSGKSSGFGITNVLYNCFYIGDSIFITDPKGEIYNTTAPTLKEKGYEVLVFNLLDMKRSMRYNPMDYANTIDEAMSISEMIIANSGGHSSDPMWSNAEVAYFASLMMYLKETRPKKEQHIKNILLLGTRIGSDEKLLDKMFSVLPKDSEALDLYYIFKNAKDKTRAGILIGFGVRLKLWVSKNVAELTSTSDFDLNMLGKQKTALFLLIPDSESTYDLLPGILIDQAFRVLYKQAGKNKSLKLDVEVRGILDEIANVAAINDLERKVSTMRSRGISVIPMFQNITQFKNRYDKDRWAEILGSIDTVIFLGTNDSKTNQYFSEKLGRTTYLINSRSENSSRTGTSSSVNHNFVGKSLMDGDEIERLGDDEAIVFQLGKHPMKIKKHYYYKQKEWSNLKKANWSEDIPERTESNISIIDPSEILFSNEQNIIEESNYETETSFEELEEDKNTVFDNEESYYDNNYIDSLLSEIPPDIKMK